MADELDRLEGARRGGWHRSCDEKAGEKDAQFEFEMSARAIQWGQDFKDNQGQKRLKQAPNCTKTQYKRNRQHTISTLAMNFPIGNVCVRDIAVVPVYSFLPLIVKLHSSSVHFLVSRATLCARRFVSLVPGEKAAKSGRLRRRQGGAAWIAGQHAQPLIREIRSDSSDLSDCGGKCPKVEQCGTESRGSERERKRSEGDKETRRRQLNYTLWNIALPFSIII